MYKGMFFVRMRAMLTFEMLWNSAFLTFMHRVYFIHAIPHKSLIFLIMVQIKPMQNQNHLHQNQIVTIYSNNCINTSKWTRSSYTLIQRLHEVKLYHNEFNAHFWIVVNFTNCDIYASYKTSSSLFSSNINAECVLYHKSLNLNYGTEWSKIKN